MYIHLRVETTFILHGQRFVWNQEKASGNVAKHGVRFEQACQVFFDPFVKTEDASIATEQREAAIGAAEDRAVLFVVNMQFDLDDALRIISGRRATAREKGLYENSD